MTKQRDFIVEVTCRMCNEKIELKVCEEDFNEYAYSPHRRLIQEIFPYLTPAERELLISSVCGKCWSKLFSDDDEE